MAYLEVLEVINYYWIGGQRYCNAFVYDEKTDKAWIKGEIHHTKLRKPGVPMNL